MVNFEVNEAGFRELRKSAGVVADLLSRGQRVASQAANIAYCQESSFKATAQTGATRARVRVESTNRAGYWSNFNGHNALVAALDAGKG